MVGYVGQIADKLDFELVEALARARPRWSFVFVGDVWETRRVQARALDALPNVHFLGRRAYHELPGYLRAFDVCAMPHRCTPLTRSMDPIKLYDYLATGKPIVSTPVAGIERFRDVIYVGDTAQAFVAGVESALQEPPALRERRLDYARHNTWSRRGRETWSLIAEHLERRTSCAVPA
jgi:glycosyltransferase involved in cell wall biosynthesis